GERLDSRRRIEPELLAQLLGVLHIPFRIECPGVTEQLVDTHPSRKIGLFGEIADPSEHRRRTGDWIEPEHAYGPFLGAPEAEEVLDQRRLAGAVFADEAKDGAALDRERHVVQRLSGA